jgi:hypothetical protein
MPVQLIPRKRYRVWFFNILTDEFNREDKWDFEGTYDPDLMGGVVFNHRFTNVNLRELGHRDMIEFPADGGMFGFLETIKIEEIPQSGGKRRARRTRRQTRRRGSRRH